jgi:enoyl-[acyl-carrier protein] reductase II
MASEQCIFTAELTFLPTMPLQTRITEIFQLEHPIIQAGMVWCSGSALAAAVSQAGGLGTLGAGSMYPEQLADEIHQVRQRTSKSFAVNIPLLYKHASEVVDVVIEQKVPVVITSAGSPKTYTQRLKENGIKVIHVVSSTEFAKKAEAAGCDAVVAEGFEAGGHNGREETTTLCLIPSVVDAVSIPVIAAGGIASGRAIAAMLALGAEGVQVGTRFVASREAYCHPLFKEKVTLLREGETDLTLKSLTPVRMIKNALYSRIYQAIAAGAGQEELRSIMVKGLARKGMLEGDIDNGELEIGQVAAQISTILPAAHIVSMLVHECHETLDRMKKWC